MSALHDHLRDYLAVRRALGYKLERHGQLLRQFLDELDARGIETITVDVAAGVGDQIAASAALAREAAAADPRVRAISGIDRCAC